MTRKRHKGIRRLLKALVTIGTLGISLVFYTVKIEPRLICTKRVDLASKYVTKDLDGLKIVQFTDTQLGPFYTLEDLKKVVKRVNKEDADLLVFTGDLIDEFKHYSGDIEEISSLLGQMKAKIGKYAIYGNHDRGGGGEKVYESIMTQGGFTVLVNEVNPLKIGQTKINIIGIDDALLGVPLITKTLKTLPQDTFNLLLIHEPDAAEVSKKFPVDLQLSGHSHGGQMRLPIIGTLITPPGAQTYTHGLYKIEGNERLKLYVSTGLGNTRLPFRFMNIPEVVVFTLTNDR